ncbi:MAG: fibronectin type III domain-containing protein, partial [bacterium]|nr:fibronectin type III domain-containing protein [bacterium]
LTPDTTAPTTPTNLSATAVSSSQINLSWNASTDPTVAGETTSGVAHYEIFRNSISIATTTALSYTNIGLTASTTYSYTVRAIDVVGNASPQSIVVSATTQLVPPPDTTAPTTPTGLSATSTSSSQINLTWSISTDNVGVSGYRVFRDSLQVGTTSATTYADQELLASTTYSYTVSAFDAAGNISMQSTSANATTQEIIPPSSVTYDFENGVMPGAFDIAPNSPWTVVTSQKHSGTYAIKSGNGGVNNSFSQLTLLANFEAGDVSFWRRYESEGNYDKFIFLIDGVVQANYPKSGSGTTWTEDAFTSAITAGVHSLDWIYVKDSSVNTAGDGVWLDDIVIPNFTPVSDKGESFESGIPATWTNDATKVWSTTSVNYRKKLGSYSARSYTPLGNNGVSTLQKTITTSGGDMWFYYYISSEVGDDLLKFYIDGVEQSNVAASGYYDAQRDPLDAGWIFRKYTVSAGPHTFKWEYSKDKGGVAGNDAAYIDLVHFPN